MDLFLRDIKSHFKLDFIDKIIISIVFIIGAILCPFYVFASEVEEVTVDDLNDVTISNGVLVERSGYTLGYFELESRLSLSCY